MLHLSKSTFLSLAGSLLIALLGTGCSSDEPGGGGGDKPEPNREPVSANISHARALIVYSGTPNDSRASEGDFDGPGLYQLDTNGKISRVAVQCVIADDGAQNPTQQPVTVIPASMQSLSKNYTALYDCGYYDEAGTRLEAVNANNLLIHKLSGKIYNIDDLISRGDLMPGHTFVHEESDGSLILAYDSTVGRLTFSGNSINYARLNNEDAQIGLIEDGEIHLASSGLIFPTIKGLQDNMAVLFPNGKYDYLADYGLPEISGIETENNYTGNPYISYFWFGDGPAALKQQFYWGYDYAEGHDFSESFLTVFKINVGNNNGKVTFTEGPSRHFIEKDEIHPNNVCAVGDKLVIERYNNWGSDRPTYIVYDSRGHSWHEVDKNFNPVNIHFLQPDASFGGRAWILDMPLYDDQSNTKLWWINPSTMQTGSLSVNLAGMQIGRVEGNYQAGYVIFKGTIPAEEKYCTVIFNLATGESETISYSYLTNMEIIMLK